MPKTRDIPHTLRGFNTLFEQLARRHDASRVFDDFLTLVLCCLARKTQEEWYLDTIRKYDEDEINIFPKLLGCLFIIYENGATPYSWVDPLGEFYEVLASRYKKSGLGQFFTPPALCNVMAQLVVDPNQWGKKINEPTCGSGRIILAANVVAKGNHYTASDLDHICVKMTCINLAMHGIKADVFQMNTLTLEKPYNTYTVNPDYYKTKTPFIFKFSP